MNFLFGKNRIYLDYSSTTPTSKKVQKAMSPFWSGLFYNPNGLYQGSVRNKKLLEGFRTRVGSFFGAHSEEVVFTSGGTESDNLAIIGSLFAYKKNNPNSIPHLIVSLIEHPAVLETAKFLEQTSEARVSYLGVDTSGVVDIDELKKILTPETILVSIMQVNNEIGSVQPIQEIAKILRHFKKHTLANPQALYPLFHTDASQGVLYSETNIQKLGVDMLSCNGGKIYGPKGVGILIKKRNIPLESLFHGGNQEFGFRPGTHSLPLIAGFQMACQELEGLKEKEIDRVGKLHDFLVVTLKTIFPTIEIHGSVTEKIPGIVSMSYPDIESDILVLELDALGFDVSSKTACKYDDPNESYVLKAIKGVGLNEEWGTLRVSIGRDTSLQDLKRFIEALKQVIDKYKSFYKTLEKKDKIM